MYALLLDHLWQSTWFVLIFALLALLLRKNGAHVRYWIWLAASIKFLVPFSLLMFAGNQIALGSGHHMRMGAADKWVEMTVAPATALRKANAEAPPGSSAQDSQGPLANAESAAATSGSPIKEPGRATPWLQRLALLIWISGTTSVLLLWLSRWIRVRRLVAGASPALSSFAPGMQIPVLETSSGVEPGIAGIVRPVLLLPAGIAGRLAAPELRAVLAHELAHWRRNDNLTASIQMLVEAVFWFHPLVWWVGAQLVREREYACDEAVLKLGEHPGNYAEALLNVCQYYVAPPLRSAAISGGDLRQRIHRIATNSAPRALGKTGKILLAGAAAAMLAVPVLMGTTSSIQAAEASTSPPEPHSASVEALYKSAQQEGEVSIMVMDTRDASWMSAAFAREFPGVRIHVTASLGHLPIVIADAESRAPGLDVVLTSLMEGNALKQGGYLINSDWTPFNIPSNRIGLDGSFAYTNNIVFTFAYDKRRVGDQPIPRTWRDLLDPRYRGLMSTNPFVMTRVVAGLGLNWGESAAELYARDLIQSQNMLNSFGDAKLFFLDEGNPRLYYVGMASTITEQWDSQGVPAGYVVPEPVIMEQQGTAVLATAPHPAAARLLAGWLASEQARAIRHQEAQSSDLLADSNDPLAVALRARNVPIVYDTSATTGDRARMAERFHPIFSTDEYNPYRPLPKFRIILPGLPN